MNQIAETTDGGHITVRKAEGTWVVRADGAVIAESSDALEISQGGQAPAIYFPRGDVAMAFLDASDTRSSSPRAGAASHYSVVSQGKTLPDAAWSYEAPPAGLERIAGHVAFRAGDEVTVERL